MQGVRGGPGDGARGQKSRRKSVKQKRGCSARGQKERAKGGGTWRSEEVASKRKDSERRLKKRPCAFKCQEGFNYSVAVRC